MNLPLTVLRSPFLEFELDRKADAIIFFEAFHHCDRPLELLDRCVGMLNPGGRLIFVADAIYDGFHAPWGLRLDGSAVYVARRYGWLELGFDAVVLLPRAARSGPRPRGVDRRRPRRRTAAASSRRGGPATSPSGAPCCRRTRRRPGVRRCRRCAGGSPARDRS